MSNLPILTESHFTEKEMTCPCCEQMIVDPAFLFRLEALRLLMNEPLNVTSGFRCRGRNTGIGGHRKSMHMQGKAVDISCTNKIRQTTIMEAADVIGFKGIGRYDMHVHLDMRDSAQAGATFFDRTTR